MRKDNCLLKRTSSVIATILMLFSFGLNLSNHKAEAVTDMATYVRNLIGTPAKEWGSGTGTQCVELPKFYIQDYFGLYTKTLALGNGNEMYKIVSQTFPSTFEKIDYYNGFVPKPGDIISYHSSSAPIYGHAAIVYEVSGSTYKIAEQWAGSNTVRSNTKSIVGGQYGVSYTIIGVARPKNQTPVANDSELLIPFPRPTGNPYLQNGSSGNGVKWLQYALNAVNNAGLTVDGQFGSGTQQAVINFQKSNGLAADGIAGPATINKIVEVRKKHLAATLLGDANCDGRVTIADSVAITQSLSNPTAYALSPQGKNNADCCDRGDGVNANDAKAINMIESGYITAKDFPIKSSQLK